MASGFPLVVFDETGFDGFRFLQAVSDQALSDGSRFPLAVFDETGFDGFRFLAGCV